MPSPGPTSQQQIRRRNLSRVLHTLAAEGPLSRATVAARTGLTRAAVSTLVDTLLRAEMSVPAANRGSDPAAVLGRLAELTGVVSTRVRAEGLHPVGLALAVPGLVARSSTTVVRAPNIGWTATDVAAHLTLPFPFTVDNEANLAALAELWLARTPPPRDFLHVSARIGIGAAVVLDGRVLRGARGFAGELGHVPVRPEGPACVCGGRGCLERYAGEEALLRAAGLTRRGPDGGPGLLASRAAAGDPAAHDALRGAGTALGIALAGAVNLLDPGAVVLGGSLAALAPWLLPRLEGELRRRTAGPGSAPEVIASALGQRGPLLGAAHSVVRTVLDDPLAAHP